MSAYKEILRRAQSYQATLGVVSKMQPDEKVMDIYQQGQRIFAENRPQELQRKQSLMPVDIQWHLIGNLQKNKIRLIMPFVSLIQSVDTFELAHSINDYANKINRRANILLEIKISPEDSKHGIPYHLLIESLSKDPWSALSMINVMGIMSIGSLCSDQSVTRSEFKTLRQHFDELKKSGLFGSQFTVLSMGMSSDYQLALEEGSNMLRVGSAVFEDK